MQSKAATVEQYLAELPEERRVALRALRKTIKANLGKGYKEGMQYGMPGFHVPHSVYPAGYHCDPKQPLPFVGFASQKNHMSLYLFCIYTSREEEVAFRDAWKKSGKKVDMGKSCVRFRKLEDLPLDLIGKTIQQIPAEKFIAHYEAAFGGMASKKKAPGKKKKAVGTKTSKKAKTK